MHTKKEMESMKMDELREIGRPLGASDTSKRELIGEILARQGGSDVGRLISDINLAKGDLMSTYELRDRILSALNRLKESEG